MSKYRNKKIIYDDFKFDSKLEYARYCELKYQKHAGYIKDFALQVPFQCVVNGKKICVYKCDFSIKMPDDTMLYEDTKGVRTPVFILKKKLVEALFNVKIIEVVAKDVRKIVGTIDNIKNKKIKQRIIK